MKIQKSPDANDLHKNAFIQPRQGRFLIKRRRSPLNRDIIRSFDAVVTRGCVSNRIQIELIFVITYVAYYARKYQLDQGKGKYCVSASRPISSCIVLRCYYHNGPASGDHLYLFMHPSLIRLLVEIPGYFEIELGLQYRVSLQLQS